MGLTNDPDYIELARFDHSLAKLVARYPDGAPDHVAAKALGMTEEQLRARYHEIIAGIRDELADDE